MEELGADLARSAELLVGELQQENDRLRFRVKQLEGNRGTHLDQDALQKWQDANRALAETRQELASSQEQCSALDGQLRAALAELAALRGPGRRAHRDSSAQTASAAVGAAATQTEAPESPRLSRSQRARKPATAARETQTAAPPERVERAAQATEPAAPERRRVSREAAKTLHASLDADMVLADVDELRLILEGGPDDLDRRRTWGTDVESAWALTLSQGVTAALGSVKQSAVAFWRELEMMRRLAGDAALAGELPTAAPPPPRQKPARRARRVTEQ